MKKLRSLKGNLLNFVERNIVLRGNGLDALYLLKAYGIGKGDEVIVPLIYIATALQIIRGCYSSFVEPNLDTYNINLN